MLLYTIDGLNLTEIIELQRCVQNEILSHKRRSGVSSPIQKSNFKALKSQKVEYQLTSTKSEKEDSKFTVSQKSKRIKKEEKISEKKKSDKASKKSSMHGEENSMKDS